jgi:two-component system, OmpR family, sensor histidine kinase MprB
MPLRRRLTLAAAAAVAVAVTLASVVAYVAVRNELRGQLDDQLQQQLQRLGDTPPPFRGFGDRTFAPLPARRGGPTPYMQLVGPDGRVMAVFGSEQATLPVTAGVRAAAEHGGGPFFADVSAGGTPVRVLTAPLAQGGAVEFGRSLAATNSVLDRLRLILLLVCLGGIALAAALGALVSRSFVAPIVNVTEAARHISETEDLSRRIDVTSQDEVGELAAHFNAMLDTLEGSIAAQRQLVADASHELRTPITSLRTNIEVLAESEDLPRDERARLLADVEEQTTELGMLVADLIELARGDQPRRDTEDVRLDELVFEAVARARRHAPGVRFTTRLEPAVVDGSRDRLARAVNNLLDNAANHSPPGAVVEVDAGPEGVRVRDHGAGMAEQDIPHLFDRFYRGVSARGRPGSGLGLAIVRQVAEQHQGSVRAANAPGGGAEFVLALPAAAPSTGELWV